MNTLRAAPKVALYARISDDATGERVGVERQLVDGRELATARGWNVVAEHSDNDISALRGKARPGYEAILKAATSGQIDHVVVWQMSRLFRNRVERATAIDLFKESAVGIMTVKGQDLDLSTASGRGMAGLLGEFDTMESEVKSERVTAAAAHRAKAGKPNGGLGFGWVREGDRYVVHPEEAAIVREIVARLLKGESLLGVTKSLNDRGVRAPNSDGWGKTSVKKIALRESNAAVRVHHRGRPTQQEYPGNWPALISAAELARLKSKMTNPARRSNGVSRPGARKHLLSWGIGECGVCGGKLRVAMRGSSTHGVKKPLYVCDSRGQCVGRDEAKVDDLVSGVVVARLRRPDALDWLLGDAEEAKRVGDQLAEYRGRLETAADNFADGKITDAMMTRISERLIPLIEEAEAERWKYAPQMDAVALRDLAGPRVADYWDSMKVAQRRAVLEALGVRVTIDRVKRRGPGFDPESVRIEFGAES